MSPSLGSVRRSLVSCGIVAMLLLSGLFVMGAAQANAGTPDSFGYSWRDSNAPSPTIAFNWIEINATGTDSGLNGGDVSNGPYPIGFNFTFYGNTFSQVNLNSKGYIPLSAVTHDWSNDPIPSANTPNNIIAAYWDDLGVYAGSGSHVYYETLGSAPNRVFVAEWDHITTYSGSSGPKMTFEIILHESGIITLQYLEMNGFTGTGATVGIENEFGTVGCEYSYNSATITDGLAIQFSLPLANLNPPHQDFGYDNDADGKYNYLVTRTNITVKENASYEIDVGLFDSAWKEIDFNYTVSNLTIGNQTVEIWFDGWMIYDNGVDGPYYMNITVWQNINGTWTVADGATNLTATYNYFQFYNTPPAAYFKAPHSDFRFDNDSDGFYDYLVVNASVNITSAGNYTVSGILYGAGSIVICNASNSSTLSTGLQVVQLFFPGSAILANGIDGPYLVWMELYNDTMTLIDSDSHITGAWVASDFSVPFTAPFFDDFESGSLGGTTGYNWTSSIPAYTGIHNTPTNSGTNSMFTSQGAVSVTSWYIDLSGLTEAEIHVWIERGGGGWDNPDAFPTEDLRLEYRNVTGAWNLLEEFQAGTGGVIFLRSYQLPADALFGGFQLRFSQLGGSGGGTDYWHIDDVYVGAPFAAFNPPHQDFGYDPDSDGMFNYLVTRINVSIAMNGTYRIQAILLDGSLNQIQSNSTSTALTVGNDTVEFWFDGWDIYRNGVDGPYWLNLTIYWDDGGSWILMDSADNMTNPYTFGQFYSPPEAYFVPPHSDSELDDDFDGYADMISVNATVNVTVAGDYTVNGSLFGPGMVWICDATNSTTLSTGVQTIQLLFPGASVFASGLNGPYTVRLFVSNATMVLLDMSQHTTGAWMFSDFLDPFTVPFYDDFEIGTLGGSSGNNWSTTNAGISGVNTVVANSGTHSMYTSQAAVIVTSWYIDLSGLTEAEVTFWVERGGGGWDNPDAYPTEDLRAEYRNITDAWNLLEEFPAGADATIFFRAYQLPADALHKEFQIRFSQLGGSGGGTDYWHIDDVYVGVPYTPTTTATFLGTAGTNGWYVSAVNVTLTATDPWSSINHTFYRISGGSWTIYATPFSITTNGTYNMTFYSEDKVNNTEPVQYVLVKIDSIAPVTVSNSHDYKLILSATDNAGGSGVENIRYRVDNGTWLNYTGQVTIGTTGSYFVEFYSVDNASNAETVRNFTMPLIDPAAPVTSATRTGTAASNGWYKSNVTVKLTATDDLSGVNYTKYRIDGGSWQTYSVPFNITSDGITVVEFWSIDFASNQEASKSVSVKIDRAGPTLAIDQADGTVFTTANVLISWNATDATSGIASFQFSFNGSAFQNLDNTTLSKLLVNLTSGSYYVIVRAIDMAGFMTEKRIDFAVSASAGGGLLGGDLMLLLLIVIIAVVAGLLLFFLLKRRKKDDENNRPPQQAPPFQQMPPAQQMPPQQSMPQQWQQYGPPPPPAGPTG